MNAVIPRRNLSSLAEPWGRTVDQRIENLQTSARKYRQDTSNALSAINSTTSKLSDQVAAIDLLTQQLAAQQDQLAEQQATLEAQQATLQSQQTTLQNQQSQLSAQVAQIQSVISNQVTGRAETNSTAVTSMPGSYTPLSSVTFTVPTGYTRAYVMAVSSANFTFPSGGRGWLRTRIAAGWSAGATTYHSPTLNTVATLSVTSSFSDFVSVTAGTNLVCSAEGYSDPAGAPGGVQISAIAIFLK